MASIIGEVIKDGIGAVGDIVIKPAEIKANVEIAEINADKEVAVAQNQVNQAQAASEDKFTSRARPFIMYVCGVGFGYQYVIQPLLVFIAKWQHLDIAMPTLDMTALCTLLIPMCGLRSMDKGSFDIFVGKKK